MVTENLVNNPELLFHHTRAEYLSGILREGILPNGLDFPRKGLYAASHQPYEYTSFFSNGLDYLRFAYANDLTIQRIGDITNQEIIEIFDRNKIRPIPGKIERFRFTLENVLEGISPFIFLKDDVDASSGKEVVLIADTKKERIIFPHDQMHDFEVCVRGGVSPDEIIGIYPEAA